MRLLGTEYGSLERGRPAFTSPFDAVKTCIGRPIFKHQRPSDSGGRSPVLKIQPAKECSV